MGLRAGERDLELGELLTGQLDQMKGLAMKVGQIVSYLDVPLPEAVQEQLARLQTGQRGMPAERVREVIEATLGRSVEACFEAFEWEPVAAASIGQVHRAVVRGRPVAVKVQYPEVARSFGDDLRAGARQPHRRQPRSHGARRPSSDAAELHRCRRCASRRARRAAGTAGRFPGDRRPERTGVPARPPRSRTTK